MNKLVSILLLASILGCQSSGSKAPTPKDSDECESACFVLRALKCPEGEDVENAEGDFISCAAWCHYAQEELKVPLNPSCVKTINQCSELETKCPVGAPRQ